LQGKINTLWSLALFSLLIGDAFLMNICSASQRKYHLEMGLYVKPLKVHPPGVHPSDGHPLEGHPLGVLPLGVIILQEYIPEKYIL